MASAQLTTGNGSGSQTATQNPQTVPGLSSGVAAQSSSLQPGTATSLLTSGQGVTLGNTALTTVDLKTATGGQVQIIPAQSTPATKHHFNPVLLGLCVVLCLVAIALFWITSRSAKNTTNYS